MSRLHPHGRSMEVKHWQSLASLLPTKTVFLMTVLLLHSSAVRGQVSEETSIASSSIPPSSSPSSLGASSSSSAATTTLPHTTTSISTSVAVVVTSIPSTAHSTTVDPTLCKTQSALKCITNLSEHYPKNGTGGIIGTPQLEEALTGLHCQPTLSTVGKSCATQISTTACTGLMSASKGGYLVDGQNNFTQFSLLCTDDGNLVPVAWNPTECPPNFERSIEKTTSAFCSLAGKITETSNTSSYTSLYCRYESETDVKPYIDPTSMLAKWVKESQCDVAPKTTITIPLSKNPVSPGAITAIVVLVCLGIVCILAAFFFWPKCHISDPALIPKKKKQEEGMINDGFNFGGASGGAQYNARNDAVAMKLPPTFGPSAA